MELGGNDPSVFFADTNIEESAKMLVKFKLGNNGQVCCAPKRLFVHASIYEEFKKVLLQEIDVAFSTDKYKNGILYGSDAIENTIKGQLLKWKERDSYNSKILRGGNWDGDFTQDLNVIEVNGNRIIKSNY